MTRVSCMAATCHDSNKSLSLTNFISIFYTTGTSFVLNLADCVGGLCDVGLSYTNAENDIICIAVQ